MPSVKMISPLQVMRFRKLNETQAFYRRAVEEVAKPLAAAHQRSSQELDMALAEIGVKVDGRDVRMSIETNEIFFEDEDWMWSDRDNKPVPRPAESRQAWIEKFGPTPSLLEPETPTPVECDTMAQDEGPTPPPPPPTIPPRGRRKRAGSTA